MENILIFGDSYSTYAGHIPSGYATYYGDGSHPSNLTDVRETWWRLYADQTGANIVLNNSWSGSTICYRGYNWSDCSKSSSFIYRFNELCDKGFFEENKIDRILVLGGTNDSWAGASVGELQYSDFSHEDLFCVLPACCYFMERIKDVLPNTKIDWIINADIINPQIVDGMDEACKHYGINCIHLVDIDKTDGHPTVKGMTQIKDQVIAEQAR